MIVADTNLVAYAVISGIHSPAALQVRAKDREWIAPPLLRYELLNVVALYVRKGLLHRDEGIKAYSRGLNLVRFDPRPTDPIAVLNLCAISQGTSYDAEFVWLAMELGIPLVSGDGPLVNSFPNVAVHMTQFVTG